MMRLFVSESASTPSLFVAPDCYLQVDFKDQRLPDTPTLSRTVTTVNRVSVEISEMKPTFSLNVLIC